MMSSPDALSDSIDELKARLEEILARPKLTSRDAEEAVEAAQIIADLLRCEERALRLFEDLDPAGSSGTPTTHARSGSKLVGLTLHEAARRVLAEAGWPMHASDLAVRIKVGGWRSPRRKSATPAQLVAQLAARLPRYPETFRRVAPNTFALTEWGDNPPRAERPKPLIGVIKSDGSLPAADIDEELEHVYEDERNQWRS